MFLVLLLLSQILRHYKQCSEITLQTKQRKKKKVRNRKNFNYQSYKKNLRKYFLAATYEYIIKLSNVNSQEKHKNIFALKTE